MALIGRFIEQILPVGSITIVQADGGRETYGPGGGKHVAVRLHDRRAALELFRNPRLKLGELYMDGRVTIEDGTILDLLELIVGAKPWEKGKRKALGKGKGRWLKRFFRRNDPTKSRRNVAHHYDVGNQLYELFLDRDLQYSCAYFTEPSNSLEQAQEDKKAHIAAKLYLKPGQRVLDIGCGWGGMALYLKQVADVDVLGITLSEEQLKVARRRAEEAGVADRVRFELIDYRALDRKFDRIVSVGMFEHVGVNHYDAYFRKIAALLNEDGVGLVHAIGRSDGPGATNPWIQKYIFPGGYSPALSEVLPAIERAGLVVTDIEILRIHYAETLKHWRERFNHHRDQIRSFYDERFCRMWDMYLAASEATFRWGGHMVFQIQVAKSVNAVPLTRDYIGEAERRLPLDLQPVPAPTREAAE